jgi:hypothetical protein
MQELFNHIDQGLFDQLFFVILFIAALIMAIPVKREESYGNEYQGKENK